MPDEYTKADRKLIRKLAGIAWTRELHAEIVKLGDVISRMESGEITPFDANDCIHQYHNGVSRELFNTYSLSDPWFAVCRAHYDGVLTDSDLSGASEYIQQGIQQFAERFREYDDTST